MNLEAEVLPPHFRDIRIAAGELRQPHALAMSEINGNTSDEKELAEVTAWRASQAEIWASADVEKIWVSSWCLPMSIHLCCCFHLTINNQSTCLDYFVHPFGIYGSLAQVRTSISAFSAFLHSKAKA